MSELEALRVEIAALRAELEALQDFYGRQIAEDRARLSKLEGRPGKAAPKTERLLQLLYDFLDSSQQRGVSYTLAANILGVSKGRISQLKPALEEDGRFMIIKHPAKRRQYVITLKKNKGGESFNYSLNDLERAQGAPLKVVTKS